jgi:hypothetical protein
VIKGRLGFKAIQEKWETLGQEASQGIKGYQVLQA